MAEFADSADNLTSTRSGYPGTQGGSGSGRSGGGRPGGGRPASDPFITYQVDMMESVGIPIAMGFCLIGTVLAFMTLTRRKLRGYSSVVYLLALFVFDLIYTSGDAIPDFIMAVSEDKSAALNNTICKTLQAIKVIGREGTCLTVLMLVFERVLLLANPKRFYGLASPKMAVLITLIITVTVLGLSGPEIYTINYNERQRRCDFRKNDTVFEDRQALDIRFGVIGFSLCGQVILSIILGVFIYKKIKIRKSDPVQSSVSAARKKTSQLNRINMISLIMTALFILVNIPQISGPFIYWASFNAGTMRMDTVKLISSCITLSSLFLVSFRFFFMLMASPKLRNECRKAICCQKDKSTNSRMRAQINPKRQKSSDLYSLPPSYSSKNPE